jgi:hypothetical protein
VIWLMDELIDAAERSPDGLTWEETGIAERITELIRIA